MDFSINKKNKNWLVVLVLVIGAVVAAYFYFANQTPGEYDDFARCLGEKKAIFYGAFWCPHCQNQKALFGKSKGLLPYVECSTPDGGAQTPICQQAKIESYPTWQFADGSRESGELSLARLAEKTGCKL